jgi:hypothetical protein
MLAGGILWAVFTTVFFSRVVLPLNEHRVVSRVVPCDPILELPYRSRDFSDLISATMTGCAVLFLVFENAQAVGKFLWLYGSVIWLKGVGMWLLPLEIHPLGLTLVDPVVELCGAGERYVRDLFFSGHVSFLCCLAICCTSPNVRLVVVASTGCVAVWLLWMRVHYTVDLFTAPLVSLAVSSFFETHDF